ncbi:MAG TPA: Nif3-like dinuclear metal center hexameric protein [Chloroflexota bacterium]|nr:Nif3-like dinuclear metal center hexameric protein [Chloroflexota bacterium]
MDTDGIGSLLEQIAPRSLAESWDNPGWQVRLPGRNVTGILLTLDATTDVLKEAAVRGCNLVFAHHPLLFKPLKSLDLSTHIGSIVGHAVSQGVSIWAAHTNLDVLPEGTSFALGSALGLRGMKLLAPVERPDYKLVVYVPPDHLEPVRDAMAEAGAGRIGDYSRCFWQTMGTGQFRPEPGANPYVGSVGQDERVDEYRLEAVVPQARLATVLEAMRRAHPYEEVAYDLLPLSNRVSSFGYGVVGDLPEEKSTAEAARWATQTLSSAVCAVAGEPGRLHGRVAVVGGSGASFMGEVVRSGATLFMTADVRYHESQEAVARGLDLVILDHYATERPVLDGVRDRLQSMLPDIPVLVATTPSTPYVEC